VKRKGGLKKKQFGKAGLHFIVIGDGRWYSDKID